MAKKKTNDPAYLAGYIPASFTPSINASQIAQIPPYEDQGVKFQSFSKKILSGNVYQLIPQQRFSVQDNQADTLTHQIAFTIPVNRKLYITSLYASGTVGTNTDSWSLYDRSLFIARFQNFLGHQEQIFFDPPLEFNNSIVWGMDQTGVQLYLNFFGWLE